MAETGLLNAVVNGLITGSIIALGGVSLSLLYSVAEVPNFAHGAMITVGAYLVFVLNKPSVFLFVGTAPGYPFWLGLVFAMIAGGGLGALIELSMFRHFRRKGVDLVTKLIATMGLALVLRNAVILVAGGESSRYETPLVISQFYDLVVTGDGIGIRILQRSGADVVRLSQWGYSWLAVGSVLGMSLIAGVAVHREDTGRDINSRLFNSKTTAVIGALVLAVVGLLVSRGSFVGSSPVYATRVVLSLKHIVITLCAVTTMGLLSLFLTMTKTGKAMRASADNLDLAKITGIRTDYVQLIVWIIAGVLTALAGALFGWFANINPQIGFSLLLPIFAAVILGGISSPVGAVIGSYIIGVTMSVGVYLAPFRASPFRHAFAFIVLLILLLVKPEGLREGY